MTLAGVRLGPYEVVSLLGSGGMGEVYRARDTRLGREVALKRLPAPRADDPLHRARLLREARAASALDHPNIVTVHAVECHDGVDFIVMELLVGQTLAELLRRGPLPLGETLRVAIDLAGAVAAAHAAGVVHGDLKPANVMLTADRTAKILDFGVAWLSRNRRAGPKDVTETDALVARGVGGTPGYMSPEQAQSEAGDARSDVFSFGALLYECVTGRRAFAGRSTAEIAAAVLRDEPEAPSGVVRDVPPELERLIRRCLRKDPERRFQSMADVRVELQEIQEERSARALLETAAAGRSTRRRLAWAAATLVAAAAIVAGAWALRRRAPDPPLLFQLTWTGHDGEGTFSPDGTQIAFSSRSEKGQNRDIWLKLVGEGEARRLTTDPAVDHFPAWSPDGTQIAFVRSPRAEDIAVARPDRLPAGAIYLVSPLGGERRILDFPTDSQLSWSLDGRWLFAARMRGPGERSEGAGAIHAIPVGGGEPRRLTTPQPPAFDTFPAIAPNGAALAYSACDSGELVAACDVRVQPLDGQLRPRGPARSVTRVRRWITGIAWTRDGRSIVFGTGRLWRVAEDGRTPPGRVELAGRGAYMPATAPRNDRLAFVRNLWDPDIYRLRLGGAIEPLIESTFVDVYPQYSPDGRRIAFESSRVGETNEIWLADADGLDPVRLTRGPNGFQGSPRWSPDGGAIAFDSRTNEGRWNVFLIGADGAGLRQLTHDAADENLPSWSRDGRWVYYTSNRTGRSEIWKTPAAGGLPQQVTREGGCTPFESVDGRTLYYMRSCANDTLLAEPRAGGPARAVVRCVAQRSYAVGPRGVFHVDCEPPNAGTLQRVLWHWDAATGRDEAVGAIEAAWIGGLAAAPDGKSVLFGRSLQLSDLMMIENFR